ncbi:MAG: TonB-dependent receptor [candidate division KSB1 bacterium]|nr:TonB-dependent receptor [candidate division KSB1 bacterium]MDZ7300645.1 TonB-dependent receptor [candidate division KSB1 bacterium]MDZ7309782.1 TonB-dependent receptor [candidate division KSB1 bacterium]
MLKTTLILAILFLSQQASGQNVFQASVKDEATQEALSGANVSIDSLRIGGATDADGKVVITNIPDGSYTIRFSYVGYKPRQLKISFPLKNPDKIQTVFLESMALESEEVFVSATRTNGVVEDSPVRVEVLGFDEVKEETAIKPGNISKLLGETSGIYIQQTSATSGNMSLRMQGLQGKYTQLLKDGFPLYGGFSSGLSLLQIPPLDLLQVEVIKGSASALYGGDAIAGLVNLVSRLPSPQPEWTVIIDQTHKKGRDLSSFYTTRSGKAGVTFLASQSTQEAFDVDKDGFTDLPEFRQTTLNPKFFLTLNPATELMLGISSSFETRQGGDMAAIASAPDSLHPFVEKSQSNRLTTQVKLERKLANGHLLTLKNSVNHFQRDISIRDTNFHGSQLASYSELSFLRRTRKHATVVGVNYFTDAFDEKRNHTSTSPLLNYRFTTTGIFAQDDWSLAERLSVQSGLRLDAHNVFGTFVLPRFSTLWKLSRNFSARLAGGMGYKIPTAFTAEAEARAFREVLPVSADLQAETSRGVNFDLSARFLVDEFVISFNQAFYYTRLHHPLVPNPALFAKGILAYQNAASPLITKGFDTHLKANLDETELLVDYTYTQIQANDESASVETELTPRHKLNLLVIVEAEQNWRGGIEVFYTGRQYLGDGHWSKDYWTVGLMLQKVFGDFSLIGNVENVFDVRQSKYEKVVLPPYAHPTFRPLYAPLDGVVANVALEIKIR